MMYKVPMPTSTNGVKLYTLPNQQIGIEYQKGEPRVGKLAHDSVHGATRDITIEPRRKLRLGADAFPRPFMSREKDMQKPLDAPDITDDDNDDDNTQAIVGKLMVFLKGVGLETEDLERVQAILSGGDEADADEGRRNAADRGRAGRQARQLAADRQFDEMFPAAKLILHR